MVAKGGLGRDIRVIVAEEPEDITELYKVGNPVHLVSVRSS